MKSPIQVSLNGSGEFEIAIGDDKATVGDYLEALEKLGAAAGLTFEVCRKCYRCCRGRIPLTVVDVQWLVRAAGGGQGPRAVLDFVSRYGWVVIEGRVVDVSLRTDGDDFCVFLDRDRGVCTVYPVRPIVCRTYICLRAGPRARTVRSAVINVGMDELVRRLILASRSSGRDLVVHEARDPCLRLNDWPATAFAGKDDPRDVGLKEVLTPEQWSFSTAE